MFEFADAAGATVGTMEFANFAQAKNARLRVHPPGSSGGDCHIQLGAEHLLFRFEYTRRGFINDVRYTLETPEGNLLCQADVVYESGKRHPALSLSVPLALEVLPSTSFWAKRFPITNRPLKKSPWDASGSWISKTRVAQMPSHSNCEGHIGLFAVRLAHFGRTYPKTHA